jgi:hypothetical protein
MQINKEDYTLYAGIDYTYRPTMFRLKVWQYKPTSGEYYMYFKTYPEMAAIVRIFRHMSDGVQLRRDDSFNVDQYWNAFLALTIA